jgi:hypothetical protein
VVTQHPCLPSSQQAHLSCKCAADCKNRRKPKHASAEPGFREERKEKTMAALISSDAFIFFDLEAERKQKRALKDIM